MSYTRAQAAAHLQTQFATLATEIGQATTGEAATGYGPDIDQALRKLGVAEADLAAATVADADVGPYLALAEYYALRRFAGRLATKVDLPNTFAREGDRRTVFDNVRALLKLAKETVEDYGYSVGVVPSWDVLRLNLDFIEPETTT